MKRILFFLWMVVCTVAVYATPKEMSFVVEGSEEAYNQIKVVNQTSLENFRCKVVLLEKDGSIKDLYGVYDLKGFDDSDTNSHKILRGTKVGIELPRDVAKKGITFSVEYKDMPFFDIVIIHLEDSNSK